MASVPFAWLACGDSDASTSASSASSSSSSAAASSSSSSTSSGAGGADTYADPAAAEMRVTATLKDLAALGVKRAGTPGGVSAGDYVKSRFEKAGYSNVTAEAFDFPGFDFQSSSLAVTVAGADVPMKHDVFQYSGAGHVDADIVDLGLGHEADYVGKDVTGKVVLVTRDPSFHREAQYRLVAKHGGVAMLYVSTTPGNLIQIGTVDDPEDGLATVPTITVGADDGQKIKDALTAGKASHAVIDVKASTSPASGRNIVAKLPGTDPTGAYILVGAHYDTWYVGATDNSSGVAAMLEIAEALNHRKDRRLGVVFVGYDAEELGLFGGYDYLRRHVIQGNEPMLAFLNLEMAGAYKADKAQPRAIAHSEVGPVGQALKDAEATDLYTTYVGLEVVPSLFGGLIPTDIQGMYWSGLQGMTTYCQTPYYHTPEDTLDKVDTAFLGQGAIAMEKALDLLDGSPIASFDKLDDKLWAPDIQTAKQGNGDLQVTVTALDTKGMKHAMALVDVWVDVDDFTRAFKTEVNADANGVVTVMVPAAALAQGKGKRWLHVTAGETYPLSERISALP